MARRPDGEALLGGGRAHKTLGVRIEDRAASDEPKET